MPSEQDEARAAASEAAGSEQSLELPPETEEASLVHHRGQGPGHTGGRQQAYVCCGGREHFPLKKPLAKKARPRVHVGEERDR